MSASRTMAGSIWPQGSSTRKSVLAQEEGQATFCRLGGGLSPLPFCYLNAPATLSTEGLSNADVPIYRRPRDLVAPLNSTGSGFPNKGQSLRHTVSGELVPYYDRGEILDGALDGFVLDEAEVIYWGLCPDCSESQASRSHP